MQKVKVFVKENKLFTSVLILGIIAIITWKLDIKGIIVNLNYLYVSFGLLVLKLQVGKNIWNNRKTSGWFTTTMALMMWFGWLFLIIMFNILTFALFYQNYIQ